MLECEVKKDIDFDSDHGLLVTPINTPKSKAARRKPNLANPKKLNIESLRDDKTRAKFIAKTVELMERQESIYILHRKYRIISSIHYQKRLNVLYQQNIKSPLINSGKMTNNLILFSNATTFKPPLTNTKRLENLSKEESVF